MKRIGRILAVIVVLLVSVQGIYAKRKPREEPKPGEATVKHSMLDDNIWTLSNDLVKIVAREGSGSFCIYSIDPDKKETAVLSTIENFTKSHFSLRVGGKEYNLSSAGGVKRSIESVPSIVSGPLKDAICITYTVKRRAKVTVTLYIDKATAPGVAKGQTVIANIKVENIGLVPDTVALKWVGDTVLGERNTHHFELASVGNVRGSAMLNLDKDSMVRSSGGGALAVDIGAQGAKQIALASLERLELQWRPDIIDGEGYNTMNSYNNSGVGINWGDSTLDAGASVQYGLTMALVTGDKPSSIGAIDTAKDEGAVGIPEEGDAAPTSQEAAMAGLSSVDRARIKALLDEINSLSEEPNAVDRKRIQELSREVDEILQEVQQ